MDGAIGSTAMTALHLHTIANKGYVPPHFNHATIHDTAENVMSFIDFLRYLVYLIRQAVRYTFLAIFLLMTSTVMYALAYLAIMPENHVTEPIFFDYNYKGCNAAYCPPTALIDLASIHTQWQAHHSDVVHHVNEGVTSNDVETCLDDSCINVTVTDNEKLQNIPRVMIPNKSYFIQVALTLPESEFNQKLGMFMIEVRLRSKIKNVSPGGDGYDIKEQWVQSSKLLAKSSRPAMLPFQSVYVSSVKKSFIMLPLILGAIPEARTIIIDCFDFFKESFDYPMTLVEVRLVVPTHLRGDNVALFQNVQIWNAELRIGKELNRLQWFMQKWFYTAAIAGIFLFALIQIVTYLGFKLWVRVFGSFVKSPAGDNASQGDHRYRYGMHEYTEDEHDNFSDDPSKWNFEASSKSSKDTKIYDNVRPDFFEEDDSSDQWIPTNFGDNYYDKTTPDQSMDDETKVSGIHETTSASSSTYQQGKRHEREFESNQDEKNGNMKKSKRKKKKKKKKKKLSCDKSELRGIADGNSNGNANHIEEAERIAAARVMIGDFQPYEIFTGKYIMHPDQTTSNSFFCY